MMKNEKITSAASDKDLILKVDGLKEYFPV